MIEAKGKNQVEETYKANHWCVIYFQNISLQASQQLYLFKYESIMHAFIGRIAFNCKGRWVTGGWLVAPKAAGKEESQSKQLEALIVQPACEFFTNGAQDEIELCLHCKKSE